MGGSNTHTGGYESDFRLLKADLLASFNQWRRHLTFRRDDFSVDERGVKGGDDEPGAAARVGECRSEYGLAREKRIRYHTYQVTTYVSCVNWRRPGPASPPHSF